MYLTIPVSQCCPVNPLVHVHLQSFTASIHRPSFAHTTLTQSSISINRHSNTIQLVVSITCMIALHNNNKTTTKNRTIILWCNVYKCVLMYNNCLLPLQEYPFSANSYPLSQVHRQAPNVFVHTWAHLSVASVHSLMSETIGMFDFLKYLY